jgi:hypothetical protein|tara:strand:+ start:787 stop:945 length:159 start_codon:yes stop_codon:yes gene_type:complete
MSIPRKTPVDYGDEFVKQGMVLITDPRADALLNKASKKRQVPQPDYTERFEN